MNKCLYCEKDVMFPIIIADGSTVCKKCFRRVSDELAEYARANWKREDFINYARYIDTYEADNAARFKPDIKFHTDIILPTFEYDTTNALYRINSGKVYSFKFVTSCDFWFKPYEIKGLLKNIAKGNLNMRIVSINPAIDQTFLLDNRAQTKGYYDDGEFKSNLPNKALQAIAAMNKFFDDMGCNSSQSSEETRDKGTDQTANQTYEQKEKPSYDTNLELHDALVLFMMEDLNNITEGDLKHQRNRLLKAYHPDQGVDEAMFSQKINHAYDILKKHLH